MGCKLCAPQTLPDKNSFLKLGMIIILWYNDYILYNLWRPIIISTYNINIINIYNIYKYLVYCEIKFKQYRSVTNNVTSQDLIQGIC